MTNKHWIVLYLRLIIGIIINIMYIYISTEYVYI